jgi:hypothetical protein
LIFFSKPLILISNRNVELAKSYLDIVKAIPLITYKHWLIWNY